MSGESDCRLPWSVAVVVGRAGAARPPTETSWMPPAVVPSGVSAVPRRELPPTLAMLLPMTESAAPLLMRPLRPVDSAPKIAIPVSSSGAVARLVHLSHLIERDRVAAHQERGRVCRKIDAVDRGLGEQAERGRGLRVARRGRDLEAVAAVGQRRAQGAPPVEREGVLAGALGPRLHAAHGGSIRRTPPRGHLVCRFPPR